MLAGALTLQQLQSVLDVKTFSRLKELLDGLAIIGLLAPTLVSTDGGGQSGGLKEARWAARATLCSKSLRRHKVGRGVQTQERANSRRDATQLIRSICPCDCMLPFLHA